MKAQESVKGRVLLFRPDKNAERCRAPEYAAGARGAVCGGRQVACQRQQGLGGYTGGGRRGPCVGRAGEMGALLRLDLQYWANG